MAGAGARRVSRRCRRLNDLGYLWAEQNKNLARASGWSDKAVEAEPDNRPIATAWAGSFPPGKISRAVAELEKAAAGNKPDGMVLDHLGDAYAKSDQPRKADAAWRKAAEAFGRKKEAEKAAGVEKKMKE